MPSIAAIWIWFCAYLNCAGWTLSALHELNARGYLCVFAIGILGVLAWKKISGARLFPKIQPAKFRRRFKKSFPLAFLILTAMAFLGGALHEPANYDALAYRTPRVLHWLDAQQWCWIHTDFARVNTRTAGWEWLTAPLFLFTGTDRLLFALNIFCFLLLPGRIFAVLTRLGVRPRAAWHWMWLLPSGYGYVLQAGSAVNDLFGSLMTLAAFEFALRAREKQKVSDVWHSGLAVALMTAVKAFNIVLVLPWLIAIFPALKKIPTRPLATAAVVLFAASASMIPTSILDAKYCGDWTGANIEQTPIGGGEGVIRFCANVPNILLENFAPPIFPVSKQWEHFTTTALPAKWEAALHANLEGGLAMFSIPELQVEETAGLGFGLSLLLLWLLLKKIRAGEYLSASVFSPQVLVPLGAWAGVGVFLIRVGISGPARYLLPFYFLLLAPMLAGKIAGGIFRLRAWRIASFMVFAIAGLLLVLSPPRPLLPFVPLLRSCDAENSPQKSLHRVWMVYSVYDARPECFAPVIQKLPPDASPLGFIAFDEPEGALWKPFGSRRIVHIVREDSPEMIRGEGLHYALVSERFFGQHYPMNFDAWLAQNRASLVEKFELQNHAGRGLEGWWLVRFN